MASWRKDPLGRQLATIAGVNCMVRPDIHTAGRYIAIVHFPTGRRRRPWQSEALAKGWCEVTATAGATAPGELDTSE